MPGLYAELGTTGGYDLSCFPNIWEDTLILAKDIRIIWNGCLSGGQPPIR